MDTLVGFLYELVLAWSWSGAQLAPYPLLLVLCGMTLLVSLALAVSYLLVAGLKRRWLGWPMGLHVTLLLCALGLAALMQMDHRLSVISGEMRQRDYEQTMTELTQLSDAGASRQPNGSSNLASEPPQKLIDRATVEPLLDNIFEQQRLRVLSMREGIDFATVQSTLPAFGVCYVTVIDLSNPSLNIHITDELRAKSLTSDFARKYKCTVAINGEAGVSPAVDAPLGRYEGIWISRGEAVMLKDNKREPFLAFDRENRARYVPADVVDREQGPQKYNVIWGRGDLLLNGEPVDAPSLRWARANPRTLMGLSEDATRLILMVVDGRQPRFSDGYDMQTAAAVMAAFGAHDAMWCDQGGSSTMILAGLADENRIVNQPSDGVERPVYAHFGVSFD